MIISTNDGCFIINMPDELARGEDLSERTLDVHLTSLKGKDITLWSLGWAIGVCYDAYNHGKNAPKVHFTVDVNDKKYEFIVEWDSEIQNYVSQLSSQFIL